MDSPSPYIHWAFFLISVPNALVIVAMLSLFALALFAPFPAHDGSTKRDEAP